MNEIVILDFVASNKFTVLSVDLLAATARLAYIWHNSLQSTTELRQIWSMYESMAN